MISKFDTLAGYATSLRNAVRIKKMQVIIPHSNLKEEITKLLKHECFIKNFFVKTLKDKDGKDSKKKILDIRLNAVDGIMILNDIQRVSKISMRVYKKHK